MYDMANDMAVPQGTVHKLARYKNGRHIYLQGVKYIITTKSQILFPLTHTPQDISLQNCRSF